MVFFFSYLTGLTVSSGPLSPDHISIFGAILLLVNSKQSLTRCIRQDRPKKFLVSFILQALAASALIIITLGSAAFRLAPYSLIPFLYFVLLFTGGEHDFLAEIAGFATLALAGLIANFTATAEINPNVYIPIALFFTASVFRIRVQVRKRGVDRTLTFFYTGAALLIFHILC